MNDAATELKLRARMLRRAIESKEPRALRRLASLRANESPAPEAVQHKHCLDIVSQEFGFRNFAHARGVFAGTSDGGDFGTLLERDACSGLLNHWFVRYEEARDFRDTHGGYLLGFRRQQLVVKAPYIEALGLDRDDPDWENIKFDWVRPASTVGRTRLYAKLLASLPRELVA